MKHSRLFHYITSIALGLFFCIQATNAQTEVLSAYPNVRLNNLTELLANENVTVADLVHDSDATGIDLTNASLTNITQAVNDLDAAWGYKVFDLGLYQSARSYQDSGATIIQTVYDVLDTEHDKFILNVFFLKNTGGTVEYISKIKFDTLGSVENSMTLEKKESIIVDCAKAANDYQVSYPISTEVFNASAKAVEQLLFSLNRAAYTIELLGANFENGDTTYLPKDPFNSLTPKLMDYKNGNGIEMQNVEWTFGGTTITSINLGQYEISNTSITLEANKDDICIAIEVIIVPLQFYNPEPTYGQKITDEKAKLITNFDGCEYRYYTKTGQILTLTGDSKTHFTPYSYSGNNIGSFRHNTTNKVYRPTTRMVVNENQTEIISSHSVLEYYDWSQIKKDASNGNFTTFITGNFPNHPETDTLFYGLEIPTNAHYRIPTTYATSLCEIGTTIRTSDGCVELTEAECDPRFINWSGQTLSKDSSLDSLLNGESEIDDPEAGKRRNIKARVFLTNTSLAITSLAKINIIISKIAAKEKIIWIEYDNDTQTWSYRGGGALNLNVEYIEFFAINKHDGNPAYNSGDLLAKLSEGANNNWHFLTKQLYEALDYLSKGINKMKIPSYVYDNDPNNKKYDPTYVNIYKYVTYPFEEQDQGIFNVLGDLMTTMSATSNSVSNAMGFIITGGSVNNDFTISPEAEFGILCGVWNGALDIISSVPEILKLVVAALNEEKRDEFIALYNDMQNIPLYDRITGDSLCQGVRCQVMNIFTKEFYSASPGKLAHNYTTLAVGIGIAFINPASLIGTFGTRIATLVQVLKKIDDFSGLPFKMFTSGAGVLVDGANKTIIQIQNDIFKAQIFTQNSAILFANEIGDFINKAVNVNAPYYRTILNPDGTINLHKMNSNGSSWNDLGKLANGNYASIFGITEALMNQIQQNGVDLQKLYNLKNVPNLNNFPDVVETLVASELKDANLNKFIDDFTGNSSFRDDFVNLYNNTPLEVAGRGMAYSKLIKSESKRMNMKWLTEVVNASGTSVIQKTNPTGISFSNDIVSFGSNKKALDFWKNESKEFFHYSDGDQIIKYDFDTGEFIFGNKNTGEIIGSYAGIENVDIIIENMSLDNLMFKMKNYHGVTPSNIQVNVSSGAIIISNPNGLTTTIVGRFHTYPALTGDLDNIITELLGGLKNSQHGAKPGGFNALNVSDEVAQLAKTTPPPNSGGWGHFWTNHNKPWLEKAMARGDDIYPASNPMDFTQLFQNGVVPTEVINANLTTPTALADYLENMVNGGILYEKMTYFGRELKLLSEGGYIYDNTLKKFLK